MNFSRPSFLGLTACLFLAALPSEAAFEQQPASVRAASMGNAFMASANESASVFVNAAGISKLPYSEFSLVYAKPFAGLSGTALNQGHASLVVATKMGNWGLGLGAFQAANLLEEHIFALSYGVNLFKGLQLGATGKYLRHSYDRGSDPLAAQDPIFKNGSSNAAFSLDFGVMLPVGTMVKLGAGVRNLNEPDVGLATEDRVMREIQAGALVNFAEMGLKISGDLMLRNTAPGNFSNSPKAFLGLEKLFYKNRLALRLGANPSEYTAGFGMRLGKNARFDYGFILNRNLLENNAGSHKIGTSYKFGAKK